MNYSFYPKIILRTPLNPKLFSIDKERTKEYFKEKKHREALFLSSPDLLKEYDNWILNGNENTKKEEKLIGSLYKYIMRMHHRCTPFGLMAACGTLEYGAKTKINIKKNDFFRATRLDMNFTCALAQKISQNAFIRPYLNYKSNSSLYSISDKIRFIEYTYKNNIRNYQISEVANNEHINRVLEKSVVGASIAELSNILINDDITYQDAAYFVKELINSQLLVSEMDAFVTGKEHLSHLKECLTKISLETDSFKVKSILNIIEIIEEKLQSLDYNVYNNIDDYKSLIGDIKNLKIDFDSNKLFQTDLFLKPNDNTLSSDFQHSIKEAIKVLNKLTPKAENTNLKNFKDQYLQRYEDKLMPLALVLDNEIGIGYAANNNTSGVSNVLLEDINIETNNITKEVDLKWNKIQSFLLKKLTDVQSKNLYSVDISLKELADFEENWSDLPSSMSAMFSLIENLNNSEKILLKSVGGTSAIDLLARFGSGNETIENICREISTHEKKINQDKIIASILHLPESRTGNILHRPVLREFEIPFLSNSSVPESQQIPLNDIVVGVVNNEIKIYSRKLKKEILPKLDNAHNYSFKALPVYHFLCDLQSQNIRPGLYFDWGSLKNEFVFLPRVKIDEVIINAATWQFKKEHFKNLFSENLSIDDIQKWREKWQLPTLILMAEGDNELFFNLKDSLSIKVLVAELKKKENVIFKEYLFTNSNLVKQDENNSFSNELITVLLKDEIEQDKIFTNNTNINISDFLIQRQFSIGSEWLYFKIYTGIKTADKILTNSILPLVENLVKNNLIDSWFFIRYADPDVHLRVRFHFKDTSHLQNVISLFNDSIKDYKNAGLIWKTQVDTYNRELERYGYNSMVISENIFCIDSIYTLKMLKAIEKTNDQQAQWLFCIKLIDNFLNNFNLKMEEKLFLLENMKIGFENEFKMNRNLKKQIDKKFRVHRANIEQLINGNSLDIIQPLEPILYKHSSETKPLIQEIISLHKENQLEIPINNLISSYTHMQINRVFNNKQRLIEMIIYDFMSRTFKSLLARTKIS